MTNAELNRDIKRLYKKFLNKMGGDTRHWSNEQWQAYEAEEKTIKEEFSRLYYADRDFKAMNKNSIIAMLRINHSLRIKQLHLFGIQAEPNYKDI